MSAAWPQVVNWLVTNLPNLPGWGQVAVFDGPPVTGDSPPTYCTVGYVADDAAGSFVQVGNLDGYTTDETGRVRCDLVANSGDDDLSAVRATVFALSDALDAKLRADQRLGGVLSANATVTLTVDVVSVQNAKGTAQALVLTVDYFTRTPG